jgi:phosphoglycerol transferase MdoB-like AlkP superfamily enzyme
MNISPLRPSGEYLLAALLAAAMWIKFFVFDSSLSPRFRLTPVTFAGGAGVLLCLVPPLLLLPPRARGPAMVGLDLALSALLLTDTVLMRYFTDLFSFRNLGLSAQAVEVSDSAITLMRLGDVKYFIDAPIFVRLSLTISRRGGWKAASPRRAAAILALITLGACGVVWKTRDYDMAVPGAIRSMWDRPAVAVSTGSLIYHASDAMNTAGEKLSKKNYSALDKERLAHWFEGRAGEREAGAASPTFGAARGANLIMIQVESLQAFVIGLTVGEVEAAPNMTRLAGESLRFTRAFNQTASGNSSDAELMANASIFPTAKGVAFMRFAGNTFRSLGSELKSLGYATAAFHGDRPGFWNRALMYPALRFDRFVSKNEFEPGEGIGLGLSDRVFFEQSLDRLVSMRDDGRPFFAFLVTLTSHYPFNFGALKKQVTDLPLGDLEDTLPGNYLRSIRYTDGAIGDFINGLEREGILNESVVVIYGDHPAIPRGYASELGALLGRDLSPLPAWRLIQSIPVLIRMPGGAFAGDVDMPAGQMDIAPTVASLMGFSMSRAFGDDLLNPALSSGDKFVIFRNGSFVKGDIWARPREESAFSLGTLERVPYTASDAKRAADLLALSDMALEADLAR